MAADKLPTFPTSLQRITDPSTENSLLVLTDPAYRSLLPPAPLRSYSGRHGMLLYASDRGGRMQAFRLDLRNGQSTQLTDVEALEPGSLTLLPDERSFCFLDGTKLRQVLLPSLRERVLAENETGARFAGSMALSSDGSVASLADQRNGTYRLRVLPLGRMGTPRTLLESPAPVSGIVFRPRSNTLLVHRMAEGSLWSVQTDGSRRQPLAVPGGRSGVPAWSADGRTIFYLHFPEDRRELNTLREYSFDTREDRLIGKTSQFVQFAPNADGSVFAGVSGLKASPYLLLYVRAGHREMTLCEHRASDATMVTPTFSPNSQRIFFQSDKLRGNPALFSIAVDRLVSQTE